MGINPGKRLGELLTAKGIITPAQLEEALKIQRSTGEFLGRLLVQRGWLTEEQLLNALSEQFGMPRVRLEDVEIDWTVAQGYSPTLLLERTCFPFRQDATSVTVAIANPLDAWTLSAIEGQARGRKIRWVLAAPWEIAAAIHEIHQRAFRKVERFLEEGGNSHGE